MKKFLTVLLALSVVFTYTVGSAFAAVPNPPSENAADSEKAFLEVVKEVKNGVFYNAEGFATEIGDEGGIKYLSKTAIESEIDAAAKPYIVAIRTATKDWDDKWSDVDTVAKFKNETGIFDANKHLVFRAQYKLDLAAVRVALAPDLSAYSTEDRNAINKVIDAQTAYVEQNLLSDYDVENANNYQVYSGRIAAFRKAAETVKAEIKKYTPAATETEKLAQAKANAIYALNKAADEFTEAVEDAYKNSVNAEEVGKLKNLDQDVAKVSDLYSDKIDEIFADSDMKTADKIEALKNIEKNYVPATFAKDAHFAEFYKDLKALNNADLLLAYADVVAAEKKAEIKEDGTLAYDPTDVAVVLSKAKEAVMNAVYNTVTTDATEPTITTVDDVFTAELKGETYPLAKYKQDAIAKFTTGKYATENPASSAWSNERYDKVVAIQDKAKDEILVADNTADIDAIAKKAKEDIDAILTKAEITALESTVEQRITALGYESNFADYYDVIVGKTGYAAAKEDAIDNAKQLLKDAVVAKENANITYAEIDKILKDNYDAALKELVKVKADAELKAAATAVDTLINALPANVTLADKDAVLAAQAALEAYMDLPGADKSDVAYTGKLQTAMATLINAEVKAVKDQIKDLPSVITVADAEKVEAARAALDALEKTYGKYDGTDKFGVATDFSYVATVEPSNADDVDDAEEALETAKRKDAADKIAALNANSTKAEVEAARAAYDALTLDSKLIFNDELYADLLKAEAQLKANIIAGVKAVKVVKNHSKAGKGYIKIAWSTVGDTSMIDGYRVYRSTKANSGYKYIFQTKNKSYKNTKNLKKGTRYYYKVRAYVELDGKRYFSDYSNKAYRAAK